MNNTTGGRPRRQRSIAVLGRLGLTIGRSAGGIVPARLRAAVQAGLLLLLLVGCATPDWWGSGQPAHTRQDIVAAHPEWPSGIRAAMASGVISTGMSPEMVRAAWGHPPPAPHPRGADGTSATPGIMQGASTTRTC
jgi:hypothetical protein